MKRHMANAPETTSTLQVAGSTPAGAANRTRSSDGRAEADVSDNPGRHDL